MDIFAASSPLLVKRGFESYVDGYVWSPAYGWSPEKYHTIKRPFFVDNGAWTAFTHGTSPSASDLLSNTIRARDRVRSGGFDIRFSVMPDRVGDWDETKAMLKTFVPDGEPWALPIQDGYTLSDVESLIAATEPSHLFIGGSGWDFKRAAVIDLVHLDVPIHVGRIADLERWTILQSYGVQSVDTSSFSRWTNYDYEPRLRRWVEQQKHERVPVAGSFSKWWS